MCRKDRVQPQTDYLWYSDIDEVNTKFTYVFPLEDMKV